MGSGCVGGRVRGCFATVVGTGQVAVHAAVAGMLVGMLVGVLVGMLIGMLIGLCPCCAGIRPSQPRERLKAVGMMSSGSSGAAARSDGRWGLPSQPRRCVRKTPALSVSNLVLPGVAGGGCRQRWVLGRLC